MSDDPLVSTGAKPGVFDAMETAKPDEPVFTLQGGDPFAADSVLFWAALARQAGAQEERPAESQKLLRKAHAAEVVAWAMRDYARGRHDQPEAEPAAATVEIADRGTADRVAVLTRGATRLYNAAAEIAEVLERLMADDDNRASAATVLLATATELVNEAAAQIEPRRQIRGQDHG